MQGIEERIYEGLSQGLREHTQRVVEVALKLAGLHGADEKRVALAAVAHDLARVTPGRKLISLARDFGLSIDPIEKERPILLHGAVGAEILRRRFGIEDGEVLEAVRHHSTARAGMGTVAKIIFLADKLEYGKSRKHPFSERLLRLAQKDLDKALLKFLDRQFTTFIKAGIPLHPLSVEARNELLSKTFR